jgi:predicted transposase/invertase (TIGR01784 family)
MKRNDLLWKGILQDLFEDFLRFFYIDADKTFDFSKRFEFLDKELEQLFPPDEDLFSPRYVDKLVKVFLNDGGEKWILVHVEVQGYTDVNFSKRMFKYYTRIFDKYDQPITAFAIFTDSNKNYHPKQYLDSVLGTEISYTFNTYKIIEQDETVLSASDNPFAIAVLSAKLTLSRKRMKDQQLFDSARELLKLLLTKQIPKKKIHSLIHFLNHYIRFENKKMLTKFEKEITILTEGSTAMGIEELLLDIAEKKGIEKGIKKGIEQGKGQGIELGIELGIIETAIKMLKSGIDINLVSNISGISVEVLEKLSNQV